jgi:DNA-binding transcriptional ArsR family regulator
MAFAGINFVATNYTKGIIQKFYRGYSEATFSKIALQVSAGEATAHLSSADPKIVDKSVPLGNTNFLVAEVGLWGTGLGKVSGGVLVHQLKLGRSDLEDEAKHGQLQLDNVEARILACLIHEPFSSICSIVQTLGVAPATVHQHLTIYLDMQPRHFRWVRLC